MSNNVNNITDYLLQLQSLTNTNLEILKTLNNSLYTKKNQLAVDIDGVTYAIPSFTSLENKINMLQENFENLVNSPVSGEAYFNFDGDSRSIEVRNYNHTPHRLTLKEVSSYDVQQNDIFKDFLTPVPYVNFELDELPNDITSVNVKKIIPHTQSLIDSFKAILEDSASKSIDYSNIYKLITNYKEDIDYTEYDTVRKLPIRKNIGHGSYVIEKILEDTVDVDLDEYITIKFRSDLPEYSTNLTYKLFNETICKNLKVGDQLVTWDSSAKMEIFEVRPTSNVVVVKLIHGEYLNLVESNLDDEISDYSKLRFYSPVDFDNDKYIQIPLEEDQYVFISIAALNDRMNVQGPWGTGIVINTDLLVDKNDVDFRTYYSNNVRNVGDVLHEITAMMSNTLTKYSKDDFIKFTTAIPTLNREYIQVTQINKHLNDSTTIQNIRSLYSQKKNDKIKLDEIQSKIDEINEKLATISFDDTSNLRAAYTASLSEYNTKKNELVTSITKAMEAISIAANDAEVPIEAAKFRVRGFFDINEFARSLEIDPSHICGIQVQYRYKNVDQEQGTAMSIGGSDGNNLFIFSDWNIMDSFINPRVADYKSGYTFAPKAYNGNINEPSFNQIDIPISQGETIDIRLKVIYDYGRPYVETCSEWSEIINIPFPSEYLKDIQVIDIIEENNNDIETNRFVNIINERGIPGHIGDKMIDQDITYYHRPESIASGFYTAERRIIPLKDKLENMNTSIQELKDEVMGTSADSLSVHIVNGEVTNKINAFQDNPIMIEAYSELSDDVDGVYTLGDNGVASTILNLVISNNSDHTAKIYPMFPGSRDTYINDLTHYKFDKYDYCNGGGSGSGGGSDNNLCRFKITATPDNATILMSTTTGENGTYAQMNQVYVAAGSTVYYIVRRNGYQEVRSSYKVLSDYELHVDLKEDDAVFYIFGIEPQPEDATVEIDGVKTKQVTVASGTTVKYKVYKTGYKTYESSYTVTQDITLYTIHLVPENKVSHTIKIDTIPADADVVINSIPTREHTVSDGAYVTIHVSRMGYVTRAFTLPGVYEDYYELIELLPVDSEDYYTITVNPTPSTATVTLGRKGNNVVAGVNDSATGTGKTSIEAQAGDYVGWTVKCEGYDSKSGGYMVTEAGDHTVNVTLELEEDTTDPENYTLQQIGDWETSYPKIVYREGETFTHKYDSYNSVTNAGVDLTRSWSTNCTVTQLGKSSDGKTIHFSVSVPRNNNDEDRTVAYELKQAESGKTCKYTATQWGWTNQPEDSTEGSDEASLAVLVTAQASNDNNGVWIYNKMDGYEKPRLQTCNQFLTFRIRDVYDNTPLYQTGNQFNNSTLSLDKGYQLIDTTKTPTTTSMTMYPLVKEKHSLCMDNDSPRTYLTLAPHEEIVVPIIVEYYINNDDKRSITKTMSFDIRTSLYQDPVNYTFSVTAKYASTTQDKLITTARRSFGMTNANNKGWVKYNSVEVK